MANNDWQAENARRHDEWRKRQETITVDGREHAVLARAEVSPGLPYGLILDGDTVRPVRLLNDEEAEPGFTHDMVSSRGTSAVPVSPTGASGEVDYLKLAAAIVDEQERRRSAVEPPEGEDTGTEPPAPPSTV